MNTFALLDLSPVLAIVSSLAGSGFSAMGLLQWIRDLGLDDLTSRMPDRRRNAILRGVLFGLTFVEILALALLVAHFALSLDLAVSVAVAAIVVASGAHGLYNAVQKLPKGSSTLTPIVGTVTLGSTTASAGSAEASDNTAPA